MTTYKSLEEEARALREEIDNSRGVGPDQLDEFAAEEAGKRQKMQALFHREFINRVGLAKNNKELMKTLEQADLSVEDFTRAEMENPQAVEQVYRALVNKNLPQYVQIMKRIAGKGFDVQKAKAQSQELRERQKSDPNYSSDKYVSDLVSRFMKDML